MNVSGTSHYLRVKNRCIKTRRHLIRGKGKALKCPSEFEKQTAAQSRGERSSMERRDKQKKSAWRPPEGGIWLWDAGGTAGDERAVVLYLNVLRWLGLSFTRIRRCPRGDLVASDSGCHLLMNVAIAGVFLLAFCCINPVAFTHTAQVQTPTVIYMLYTKLMTLTIVVLSFCGNWYNRKFISIFNLLCRVTRSLERELRQSKGGTGGKEGTGCRLPLAFCAYLAASMALNLWTDSQLSNRYERAFRTVHFLCYCYVIFFTAHFVITMNYIKAKFKRVNASFGRIVAPARCRRGPEAAEGAFPTRKELGRWMAAFMELREVEGLANEVFGKQIFLLMMLAFSRFVVNAYYLITLNLNGTSTSSLNTTMWLGLFQAVLVPLVCTTAAELTANEVNKINEIIFHIPVHLQDWQMLKQVHYFALFSHYHRVEFKVWIFYAINYASLLKVILTSSAITVIILQWDLLKTQF